MGITLADIARSACAPLNQHLLQSIPAPKKRSKYGNKKAQVSGHTFDSIKEAKRYGELKMMQKAGLIGFLELQVVYELKVNEQKICSYIADFVYVDAKTGEKVVEDVKSPATRKIAKYRQKKKLMKAIYNIEIKEV